MEVPKLETNHELVVRNMRLGDGREITLTELIVDQIREAHSLSRKSSPEDLETIGFPTILKMNVIRQALKIDGEHPTVAELLEFKHVDLEAIWWLIEFDNKLQKLSNESQEA